MHGLLFYAFCIHNEILPFSGRSAWKLTTKKAEEDCLSQSLMLGRKVSMKQENVKKLLTLTFCLFIDKMFFYSLSTSLGINKKTKIRVDYY